MYLILLSYFLPICLWFCLWVFILTCYSSFSKCEIVLKVKHLWFIQGVPHLSLPVWLWPLHLFSCKKLTRWGLGERTKGCEPVPHTISFIQEWHEGRGLDCYGEVRAVATLERKGLLLCCHTWPKEAGSVGSLLTSQVPHCEAWETLCPFVISEILFSIIDSGLPDPFHFPWQI